MFDSRGARDGSTGETTTTADGYVESTTTTANQQQQLELQRLQQQQQQQQHQHQQQLQQQQQPMQQCRANSCIYFRVRRSVPSKLMSCSSSHFHCIGVRTVVHHFAVRLLSPTAPFVGFFSTPVFIYQKLLCDLFALKLKEVLNFKLCNAF